MFDLNFFREKRSFQRGDDSVSSDIFSISDLELDRESLECYLKLGYVPGDRTLFKKVKCIGSRAEQENLGGFFSSVPSFEHNKKTLKDIFIKSIESRYQSGTINVVPLSGGMDSRIILAALCELTSASNIHTYTFGVPGAYDYEIPNRIAAHFGTKHTNFDAKDTTYTVEGLVRAAIASGGNTEVFHPLVLNRVADHYQSDSIYWSGFAGDVVGGAFGEKFSGEDPKQELIDYEKRGIYFLDGTVSDQELYPYIASGDKMKGCVSASEACFWENHMERYTGHHVFRNDMKINAPLVDVRLLKFFFSLPDHEREGKVFFNREFSQMFPDFFDFPTKDYGYKYSRNYFLSPLSRARFYFLALAWRLAPRIFSHPDAAYIDMRHAINDRADVRACVDQLLADLAKRNLVDNGRMFRFLSEHRRGLKVYTKDIINLASLEVILKAASQ